MSAFIKCTELYARLDATAAAYDSAQSSSRAQQVLLGVLTTNSTNEFTYKAPAKEKEKNKNETSKTK